MKRSEIRDSADGYVLRIVLRSIRATGRMTSRNSRTHPARCSSAPCPSRCAAVRRRRRCASACLKVASLPSSAAGSRASVTSAPWVQTTTATTPSPKSACGTPITADSTTPGDRVDLVLDFLRVDVEAAGDDEVLAPADDVDIAVVVDLAEVAGDEVAVVAELGLRLFGHPPVALEDVRALDLDHADFAARERRAGLGSAMRTETPGRGKPDRAGRSARRHRGWRRSCWSRSCRSARGWRGRCARNSRWVSASSGAEPEMKSRMWRSFLASGRDLQQPRVEGRHAHHHGGARHQLDDPLGIEFGQEDHRGAGEERVLVATNRPCVW